MQPSLALLRIAFASLAACLVVAGANPPAGALSVTPDPAVFNIPVGGGDAIKGSIDFVGMVTGVPTGGIVLAGSTAATDVTFVFTITLDADALPDSLFSTNVGQEPFGAGSPVFSAIGTIPGTGPDIVDAFVDADGATWLYDPLPLPGETADPFFLSFSSIAVGDQFRMEEVVLTLGTFTVVPEPGMMGLFALGVGALGWRLARLRA